MWMAQGHFLGLRRQFIIAGRRQSPLINLVQVDINFPWLAITGGKPLAAWHAMLFSSVAAKPHLLSDTSRTVGLWLFICLEGLADMFLYLIISVSHTCHFNKHVIAYLNCTEVTVLAVFKVRDERDECVFEKKINLSVGHLPENFESNGTGSELTEQLMRLGQTAHMLVIAGRRML